MYNNIELISSSQAFKPGADLWCLTYTPLHFLTYKIDWYLGFKIRKNQCTKLHSISSKIPFYTKYNLPTINTISADSPTLIESSQFLPNLWTVTLPYTSQWLKNVYNIWYNLNKPRLRIFIPSPVIKKQDIKNTWEKHNNYLIQYVVNTEK